MVVKRNPAWTKEELILALDLYIDAWNAGIDKNDNRIKELSETLNGLLLYPKDSKTEKYRNINGVYMKLANFARFDSSYSGKGFTHGNKLERVIWDEYSNNRTELRKAADAIRAFSGVDVLDAGLSDDDQGEMETREGKLLFKIHLSRERNRTIILKKKQIALRNSGRLFCEICGFDFQKQYIGTARPFIECHHKRPLVNLRPGQRTSLEDLILVCSNCHRMLHLQSDSSDIENLQRRVNFKFTP